MKIYHLITLGGTWMLRHEGAIVFQDFATKEEAIESFRQQVGNGDGTLNVYASDGTVTELKAGDDSPAMAMRVDA